MTKDVVLGFVRHILTFGGGLLSTKGVIAASDVELAVGAIVTLGGIIWSAWDKRKKAAA